MRKIIIACITVLSVLIIFLFNQKLVLGESASHDGGASHHDEYDPEDVPDDEPVINYYCVQIRVYLECDNANPKYTFPTVCSYTSRDEAEVAANKFEDDNEDKPMACARGRSMARNEGLGMCDVDSCEVNTWVWKKTP